MTAALDAGRPFTGRERDLPENTLELVPSLTTPISLIKHCAAAERIWFQRTLAGRSVEACDGYAIGGDGSFHVADDETLGGMITEYLATCALSNELADRYQLDDLVEHHIVGTVSLRFIYLGMIADVAGHADILAEQIQANTTPSTTSTE